MLAWMASPHPGLTTTMVVSVAAATSTSCWPTPTVSTSTTGTPTADEHPDGIGHGHSQTAEVAPGGHGADEDLVVEGVVLHPDPVAQDGPARERRRRIDGQHRHLVAAVEPTRPGPAISWSVRVDLPAPGRPGDSHRVGLPGAR